MKNRVRAGWIISRLLHQRLHELHKLHGGKMTISSFAETLLWDAIQRLPHKIEVKVIEHEPKRQDIRLIVDEDKAVTKL